MILNEFGPMSRRKLKNERASLREMYAHVRPQRQALLAGAVLSLATGAAGLLLPLVVRLLIEDLSRHRGITVVIVTLCLVMLADAVLGAAGSYVLLRAAETIVLTARKRVIGRLIRITVGTLDRSEPGDLMARATADTVLLRRARALLRRPRLLLLDEVTSQLDAINEAALRETIADTARQTTVLVVAHRLSTVMTADRTIAMDAGLVQATGTYAELVAASPLYAELAATQFLAQSDGRAPESAGERGRGAGAVNPGPFGQKMI